MFQALFGFISRHRAMQQDQMPISATGWFSDRLKWCPTSFQALEEAERKVLSYLKRPFAVSYVEIVCNKLENICRIRTLTMNEDDAKKKTPLVMLHGLGAAIGLWVLNLDTLSNERPLYAIDVLGFGLSSRPTFSSDALEVEEMLVESVESWRETVGLEKFILLGHSMGGFIATAYAMKYPEHIHHLILADPWGFPERDTTVRKVQLPFWAKMIANVLQYFNPFVMLRVAGPWGPQLVEKTRPDILQKFTSLMKDHNDMANYIYHCNAQPPSGEVAFKTLSSGFGWAKHPMIPRITSLSVDVPITFLYGARSWMDCQSGHTVKQLRNTSKVEIKMVQNSGHHVNADQPSLFHTFVQEVCDNVDKLLTHKTGSSQVIHLSQIDPAKCDIFDDSGIEQTPSSSSLP